MDKKSISALRREFKLESYALQINEVYSVYLKKDNGEILTKSLRRFNALDTECRELYLNNFKKVLTGTIDTKLFEVDFKNKNFQTVLSEGLNSKRSLSDIGDKLVAQVSQNFNYDTDIVFNFITASYYKSNKKEKSNEGEEDYIQAMEFILCSINKVSIPKKELTLAYPEMEFKTNSVLDITIDLGAPLDGFIYPGFGSDYTDVDKIIYYSHKANHINNVFVEDVLSCTRNFTASEEKQIFNSILRESLENKIKPKNMENIYEEIYDKVRDSEEDDDSEIKIDMEDVINILHNNGLKDEKLVKDAFQEICGEECELKAHNLLADFQNKSIKIENSNITLLVNPNNLGCIRVSRDKDGQKCLMVKLVEDITADGINIETEE